MAGVHDDEIHEQQVIVGDQPAQIAARVAAAPTNEQLYPPLIDALLRMGDDGLILTQRLMEWSANAPVLEEDIALSNTGLDLLGQARMFYQYAGSLMEPRKSEDDLAYWRGSREFRCAHIAQMPNGDFAQTVARQLAIAIYLHLLYTRLSESTDPHIAAIAQKSVKEVAYHVDHFTTWTLRLGDGTDESRRRMQTGLDVVWPYVDELFDADAGVVPAMGRTDDHLSGLVSDGVLVDTRELRDSWLEQISATIETATCTVPEPSWHARGGRRGEHTPALDRMLAEMQSVARSMPGVTW